ncbi:MAG TPA: class II glutamine amidotransferase [Streptosporangiaceae bacterium]|nr:class II glutamine amidotransferase [Streptosporangiaceae bacterium]
MCEILAVRWPEPRPFSALAPWAQAMEYYGSGKFGWGVAWLADGQVHRHRDTGRLEDDEAVKTYLSAVTSTHFLIHFRRPTLLSTIQLADTQPFITVGADLAFSHNGLFTEHETYRPAYSGRLSGAADSEVGFCMLQDVAESGVPICDALAIVHSKLGGKANMATLDRHGVLALYSNHETNRLWTFRAGDAEVAATELHSPDDSLFNLIFQDAINRAVVDESAIL